MITETKEHFQNMRKVASKLGYLDAMKYDFTLSKLRAQNYIPLTLGALAVGSVAGLGAYIIGSGIESIVEPKTIFETIQNVGFFKSAVALSFAGAVAGELMDDYIPGRMERYKSVKL